MISIRESRYELIRNIYSELKEGIEAFLNILYFSHDRCLVCDEWCEEYLCEYCYYKIRKCNEVEKLKCLDNKIDCYSAIYYNITAKKLMSKFKYKSSFRSGELLAKLIIYKINKENINADIITYVPMRKIDEKKRGYNQAELLVNCISKEIKIGKIRLLNKVVDTEEQKVLSIDKRWENVANCFEVINKEEVFGKEVLLIDDVFTTGATTYHCSEALLKSGAKKVIIVTAARVGC